MRPGGRRGGEQSLPGPPAPPRPHTPRRVSAGPPAPAPDSPVSRPHSSPALQPPQRTAQRPRAAQRSPAAAGPAASGQRPAPPGSLALAAAAVGGPGGSAEQRALVTSGATEGERGVRGGGHSGWGGQRVIPVTRFKEMEEGETGYPMAREDRERTGYEGWRQPWRTKRAEEATGTCPGSEEGGSGKGR